MKKKMIVTSAAGIMLFSNLFAVSPQALAAQTAPSSSNTSQVVSQETTQSFTLKGANHATFAQINVTKNNLHLQTFAVKPNTKFRNVYASIKVKRVGYSVFSKDFIGNKLLAAGQKNIHLEEGDIVTITHREANDANFIVSNADLKGNTSGNYTYMVRNGQLENITLQLEEATKAINNLFNGRKPKPNITQEQLDLALEKLEALPNDYYFMEYETLYNKLEKANTAYLDSLKLEEAKKAVDALYNGNTPRPDITQEQLEAAADKLYALPENLKGLQELAWKLQDASDAFMEQNSSF
ncbi:putative mucin/carbohydrate-binding domain-containing protein [Enterococcus ratti]|uniref:putative mucin/carbohydrate-binding domain-containing protein n=1 Tax=Enterococcus ratti TaxID=150033 RepID=UPI003512965B